MDIIEVARFVGTNYFRRGVHRITSSGSAHKFLPIVLDETGKLDRSLYNDADIGDVLADAGDKAAPADADTMPLNDSAATNALKKITWANIKAAIKSYTDTLYTDHGALGGRTDDDHTQYALLAGRAGGQTIKGGTASGNSLTLESTNHATKGNVALNPSSGTATVATSTPASGYALTVNGKVSATAINVGESDLTVFDDNGTSWTPTITTSGNPPDTLTYTTQIGYYTRFNNVVFYHFTIAINAFSLGTGTGNARFSLPFTAVNDAGRRPIAAAMTSTVAWPAGAQQVVFRPTVNAAYGNLSGVQSDATVTVVRLADLAAGDTISVSGFYYI